jgi:hypothetical protein
MISLLCQGLKFVDKLVNFSFLPPGSIHVSPTWLLSTGALSLTLGLSPLPSVAQQPLECKSDKDSVEAKLEIVGGVVFCTKSEKKVEHTKPDCYGSTPETVYVYFTSPEFVATTLKDIKPALKCASIIGYPKDSQFSEEPKSIIIAGDAAEKDILKQRIVALDQPKDRINLDLWAIQISSASPAKLSSVMSEVQRQIEDTRTAMRKTYTEFIKLSQNTEIGNPTELTDLGFGGIFPGKACNPLNTMCVDPRTSLSLTDMLINLNFAKDRIKNYNHSAKNICKYLVNEPGFELFNAYEGQALKAYDTKRIFNGDPARAFRRPFQRFMTIALHQHFDHAKGQPTCEDGLIPENATTDEEKKRLNLVLNQSFQRRQAILNFAADFSAFKSYQGNSNLQQVGSSLFPGSTQGSYDPNQLRKSTAELDSLVYPIVDALQQDIEDYFIRPTLFRIRQIVSRERNVQYAEVGRTTISALNGLEVTASSKTVTSVDEPTPLRLNKLINDAATINDDLTKLNQGLSSVPLGSSPSALSAGSAISLAAALSKEETRWRAMTSGIDLTITPTVFLDRTAAELKVKMKIGNPAQEQANPSLSKDNPLSPLSRISESNLQTKVYVNTMDLFALSSFNNQTTLSGRRWYVPLVGTVWEGAFGDIPVVGNLFSFKRPTQNIQHQSIILANTLIIPSAMGMSHSYCGSSCRTSQNLCVTSNKGPVCNSFELPVQPKGDPNSPNSIRTSPGAR